jgi:hypothetical protein
MKLSVPAVLTAALVASLTMGGSALAQEKKKDGKKSAGGLTVRMTPLNNSGESGTARLTPQGGDKTQVVVNLKGAPKEAQPVHVHEGTCAKLDPKPKYPLQNVVDGKSTSEVPAGIDALTSSPHAINVHKSTDDPKTYVACGDIRKGGAKKAAKKEGGMDKK